LGFLLLGLSAKVGINNDKYITIQKVIYLKINRYNEVTIGK